MKKNTLQFFFLIIFFSCIILNVQGHGKKQIKALNRLSMAKRNNNNNIKSSTGLINTSHFETIPHLQGIRILPQQGLKEKDAIEKLPGQPDVNFRQYGGYVTVNESTGRALYYYFAQAQHSKDSLPLLLWLNGGPGCSSLGYGAMQELGPFRVHSDGKTLHKNLFAWNHAANVLFVETPAGVGFSYSNTTSDYDKSGDKLTAADNYVFLLNWLERFPEYKDRDFYISGESYAGHYVPQLAHTILHYNKQANKTLINLKGIIIGNAVINDETDTKGVYNYLGSHGIISYETSSQIEKYCDASSPNATTSKICGRAMEEADMEAYYNDKLDIYNIYASVCTNSNLTLHPKKTQYAIDPCSEYYTYAYLNRPEVQEALHANVTKLDHPWASCWADIPWKDTTATVIPLLKEFMANSLRVWIYSGDTDGVVPITSTQYSINAMNLKIKSQWHPWILKGQIGGYTQVYEGDLTFATVRGAGHQVPSYEPRRALGLIMHFLSGKPLPSN